MSLKQEGATAICEDNHVVVTCHTDAGKAVCLAGSFNEWNATAMPMTGDDHGNWKASIPLAPGRYEYKFVVDGEWCCEPGCTSKEVHCSHCIMNEFGTMNRVLEVQ